MSFTSLDESALCRSCGACCSFSRDWPRFTTEDDSELERIPRAFVDDSFARMRCDGDRCAALVGEVGISTTCAVYSVRPEVCRACQPGDEACQMARQRFGLWRESQPKPIAWVERWPAVRFWPLSHRELGSLRQTKFCYRLFLPPAALPLAMPGAGGKDDEACDVCGFGLLAFGFLFSRLPLCSRFAIATLLSRGVVWRSP